MLTFLPAIFSLEENLKETPPDQGSQFTILGCEFLLKEEKHDAGAPLETYLQETREPENVCRILKEIICRKAGNSSLETFYKAFYGIMVRGMLRCGLPIFERPIQPSVSKRFLASDMGELTMGLKVTKRQH